MTFVRPRLGTLARATETPPHEIDQVFVAALNMKEAGGASGAEQKMRFLLRAAYQATYAAAALRGVHNLVLTCVGGGVFRNPAADVAAALAEAHALCAPRSGLKRVLLPLFSVGADPSVYVAALEAAGGRCVVINHGA